MSQETFKRGDVSGFLEALAGETGIPPAVYVKELLQTHNEFERFVLKLIRRGRKNPYVVIGTDGFEGRGAYWLSKRFPIPEEAREDALARTIRAARNATHQSVATVYYAYGPATFVGEDGRREPGIEYLGGNAWTEAPDKIQPWVIP